MSNRHSMMATGRYLSERFGYEWKGGTLIPIEDVLFEQATDVMLLRRALHKDLISLRKDIELMVLGTEQDGKIYDPLGRSDCEAAIYSKARQIADRESALEVLIRYINAASAGQGA